MSALHEYIMSIGDDGEAPITKPETGNPVTRHVEYHLEEAHRFSKRLKDPSLEKMIEAPLKHVKTKTNPETG